VTSRDASRLTALASFGWAIGLGVVCGALVREFVSPHEIEISLIGNDVVASFGLAWAVARMAVDRRNHPRFQAWGRAALAMLLLLLENHVRALPVDPGATVLYASLSAALWIGAAYLCYACARRYVMTAARAAVAVGLVATGLAFFAINDPASGAQGGLAKVQEAGEFLSLVLFVGALLLTQVGALKPYRFAPADLGLRARSLQYDFWLERRRKYPTPYRVFALPGASHLLIVAMIAWCGWRAALRVAQSGGRSIAGQIIDMLRLGFGEGVDAKSYYVLDLYRQTPHGSADQTMTRVETKNGLNRAVQNLREHSPLPREMGDKLAFWRICEEHGIPSAAVLASVERGHVTRFAARQAFDRHLFVKVRRGRGGKGTMNFERIGPFTYCDDRGVVRDLLGVCDHLRAASASCDLILQPKLANHPAIASLADRSLIVFRVVTCLDRRDEPHVTHGILRILRRFEPGWPRSPDSDWGCAIHLETGELGMMTGDAPATCTKWFADHPRTGERVHGRRLEGWGEIARAAAEAHRVFRGRILVGWDIGWTPEGVRILEGNSSPDFSYFQRVYRTPVGRSPLAPLLNAHLDMLTERLLSDAAG